MPNPTSNTFAYNGDVADLIRKRPRPKTDLLSSSNLTMKTNTSNATVIKLNTLPVKSSSQLNRDHKEESDDTFAKSESEVSEKEGQFVRSEVDFGRDKDEETSNSRDAVDQVLKVLTTNVRVQSRVVVLSDSKLKPLPPKDRLE